MGHSAFPCKINNVLVLQMPQNTAVVCASTAGVDPFMCGFLRLNCHARAGLFPIHEPHELLTSFHTFKKTDLASLSVICPQDNLAQSEGLA